MTQSSSWEAWKLAASSSELLVSQAVIRRFISSSVAGVSWMCSIWNCFILPTV